MSQYTISIKSIIDIATRQAAYAETEKRVELGRGVLFPFNYDGDAEFKILFENAFILQYMNENICYQDVAQWLLRLHNDMLIKAPIYYNRYEQIKRLMEEDIKEVGGYSLKSEFTESGENNRENNEERRGHGYSRTFGDNVTRLLGSQFPQEITKAVDFEDVKHMDSGSLSDNESDLQSNSDTKETASGAGKDTSARSGKTEAERTEKGNRLDRLEKYFNMQRNIIQDFVNSFSNLFMQIW